MPLAGAVTAEESRFVVVTSLMSLAVGAAHAAGLCWARLDRALAAPAGS